MMQRMSILCSCLILSACSGAPEPLPPEPEFDFPAGCEVVRSASGPDGRSFTLTVPADTYVKDMNGDFRVLTDETTIAPLRDGLMAQQDVMPIAHPVELTFDTAQVAQTEGMEIVFELTLEEVDRADAEGRSIYAYLLETGRRAGSGGATVDEDMWSLALGHVERLEDRALLHVRLYASSETMTVIPVIGERFSLYTTLDPQAGTLQNRFQQQNGASDQNSFLQPWALLCRSTKAEDCNTDFSSNSPLVRITHLLQEAGAFYHSMGFTRANLLRRPYSEVVQLGKDNSASLGTDLIDDPDSQIIVNVGIVSDPFICQGSSSGWGCYNATTRLLSFPPGAAQTDAQHQGDPAAHELFHAIHAAMMPRLLSVVYPRRYNWVMEAPADAMAYWKLALADPAAVLQSKTCGQTRSWQFSLQDYSDHLRPTRTWEFFARQYGGDLNWMVDFFDALKTVDVDQHPYRFMDQAFQKFYAQAGSPKDRFFELAVDAQSELFIEGLNSESNLGIAYLNMVTEVNPGTGYEHCTRIWELDIAADAGIKIDSESDTISPLSMDCLRVISSDHHTRHGNACIKLTLESAAADGDPVEFGNTDLRTVLVVTGADAYNERNLPQSISYDGEPLWVDGSVFTAQIVDLNLDEAVAAAPAESERIWTLHAEIDETCGQQAGCYPARIRCFEQSCYLQMNSPGTDCWGNVARCDDTGCYERVGGDFAPHPLDDCADLRELLQGFRNPPDYVAELELTSWTVPVTVPLSPDQTCDEANFCRRIILCAK